MRKGFTLIELGVVVTTIAILLSIITINLTSLQQHSYMDTTLETLLSDIKNQQLKSMLGDTEGEAAHEEFGIYFEADRYTLFRGTTYDSDDPFNFTITLPESIEFTNIQFPSALLIFEKGSGEVIGHTESTDSIALRNITTNETKTITVNLYGVFTGIN